MFRSTESERFNLDTLTGFGKNANRDRTPIHEKNSILGRKPFIGGKTRHQLIKSPERSFTYGGDLNSAGGMHSEMRPLVNQKELQKEIEEDIGMPEDNYEDD